MTQKLFYSILRIGFFLYFCTVFNEKTQKGLSRGVTGNTSDFGSEESRFEPWRDNQRIKQRFRRCFFYTFSAGTGILEWMIGRPR